MGPDPDIRLFETEPESMSCSMQIDLIALDADDTLWHNEIHYQRGRKTFNEILKKYGFPEVDEGRLHSIEIANLEYYGYGAVGFAVSLAEAAVEITDGKIGSAELLRLIAVSKDILSAEVELYAGVEETVRSLSQSHNLMLITKGDARHQFSKIQRSGLIQYFDHIEIVTEKSSETYRDLLEKVTIPPDRFIMVGNAMKSDILPVLELGSHAVYIHNELTWAYENATESELPEERFYKLETITELPMLIQQLEG